MSVNVEKLEKNMAKLTIEVTAEEFEEAMNKAYIKNKGKLSVPGFRKGKVPRAIIEKNYGAGIFYEDAANEIIPEAYDKAAAESGLEIVSQPTIDVVQIEKGKNFIFTAEVALRPEVKLGEYKGLKAEKTKVEVKDEDIDEQINKTREMNARTKTVEGRAVKDGDIAVIDYEGFCDGVAFDGGKAENHELIIGSHSFIDTFEDQIIGKNTGDEFDVNVTFPEEYHAENLKGKAAVFKVKINDIKEKQIPEADDDFAQEVSEFNTFAEYKADVKAKLVETKEKEARTELENKLIDKLIENSTMEIPDAMIETQTKQMAEDFARRLQSQGLSIDKYFEYTGLTVAKMLEDMKPQALKRIQSRLVLEAVVDAEKIEASDAEVDEEIEQMAKMYQMEADKVKEVLGEEQLKSLKLDVAVKKAVDFIVDSAK